jgi:hypothetical protein
MFLCAGADLADRLDLILLETCLITGDNKRRISGSQRYLQSWGNSRTIIVVVGVLDKFQNKMRIAGIEILRET